MRMSLFTKQLGTAYKGDGFSTLRVILLSLICSEQQQGKLSSQNFIYVSAREKL